MTVNPAQATSAPATPPGQLRLPAEFEPHAATWMAWPTQARPEVWGGHLDAVRSDYARLAQTIARFEPMRMVANPADAAEAARRCGPSVAIVEIPIDDAWARDSGPVFLSNGAGGVVASAWRFTGWGGKYAPIDNDARLARNIAARLDVPVIASELALEGGAIYSDGQGTLLTTETCLLNANRNPGLTRAQVDAELKRVFRVEKVIWLPGDPTEDETNGHIDGLMALAAPGKALVEVVADPADPRHEIMRENRRALALQPDARGRHYEMMSIAEADRSTVVGDRYCRSYVNFYIVNGAVIAPAYGIAQDEQVRATLQVAYPDRTIVMLPIGRIATGGGGFHCITQQQPA